jgi:hypothetical protein
MPDAENNETDYDCDDFSFFAMEATEESLGTGEHPFACACDFCWYDWDDDEIIYL